MDKSQGVTQSEQYLPQLCQNTFLKLWCFPNPYKSPGKELCDLLVVFEEHVFIFFDRESRRFDRTVKPIELNWERWKKEAVEKQIKTATGAKRQILRLPDQIFLDDKCLKPLPVNIDPQNIIIHKIVVAHGAKEACRIHSEENVYGSLAISYGSPMQGPSYPFLLSLERESPVHVLDSHNLEVLLNELNTITDFSQYLTEKERAISKHKCQLYCGEEDLLGHYLLNYDNNKKRHFIGCNEEDVSFLAIGEGEWHDFIQSNPYMMKKNADRISYHWDNLLQRTCDNALKGILIGESDLFNGPSAIHEMAKESRLARRALSQQMLDSVEKFPENMNGNARNVSFFMTPGNTVGYVLLQLCLQNITDYEGEYRPMRQEMLRIACGVAKNKFPELKKVIGIGIEPPKHSNFVSEDFILLNCKEWSEVDKSSYDKENEIYGFFNSKYAKNSQKIVTEFPILKMKKQKVGRNSPCPCGSGKKFKKCCINQQ